MKNLPKKCRRCEVDLNDDNWGMCHQRTGRRICNDCHNKESRERYYRDLDASRAIKRAASRRNYKPHPRPKTEPKPLVLIDRDRHSLAKDEKGQTCRKCGCKLTTENWLMSFRRRKVKRCGACHYALTKAYAQKNPEKGRERTAAWRLRNPEHAKIKYRENIEYFKKQARNWLWNIKSRAFLILGGKCACCGNDDIRVLQVNHKNGGGTQEKRHGDKMYKAIIDGTRPIDDLDLRCANCNLLYEYERGKRALPAGADPHLLNLKIEEAAA